MIFDLTPDFAVILEDSEKLNDRETNYIYLLVSKSFEITSTFIFFWFSPVGIEPLKC